MLINEGPKDVFGRTLHEGDGVIVVMRGPVLFRVAKVETVLDPRQPAGLHTLHLFATAAYTVKAGAKHGEFIRVGTLEELGPVPFEFTPGPTPERVS